ncbi:tRNA (adenosine(37)-N6)-dimethylallyltransferase MiaA [Nanchangia anserum]|uniref:tRNA (adenosine(37)-N6)-dimethylallyltransferase MiaA n=1 Tax=Nanchangia anserum TaxID=2692125 RepID=UPI001D11AB18|nr:tRNA (adenosine(37)-N6)-dimethylallyltransferase MiaA [Nanchangia anserum]
MTVPIIAFVGPTASGKSECALDFAESLGRDATELIGADAFQLYRGMDIGTAKTPLEQRRGIVHHLIDVLDIDEEASVAAYQTQARAAVDDITRRGRVPLVCGGSGLYVRAMLDHLEFPGTDPALRDRIEQWGREHGAAALHRRLAAADPVSATRIDPANTRRVVRALEVCELTGRPFSATLPSYTYVRAAIQVGLRWDRAVLRDRIEQRALKMVEAGFLDEVRDLASRGLSEAPTAVRATGYREALSVLAGELPEADLAAAIAQQTWKLARRQITWFRRDPRITWLDGEDPRQRDELFARLRRDLDEWRGRENRA